MIARERADDIGPCWSQNTRAPGACQVEHGPRTQPRSPVPRAAPCPPGTALAPQPVISQTSAALPAPRGRRLGDVHSSEADFGFRTKTAENGVQIASSYGAPAASWALLPVSEIALAGGRPW